MSTWNWYCGWPSSSPLYSYQSCDCSRSAAEATWRSKSLEMARVVSVPTITANPSRITSVSAAEPPASRQRIGWGLYAGDVARAADRMEESRLATGFKLPSEIRDEDLDRVRDRERVIAPHLIEQLLAGDHQALVAHQVLEQLELALREVDLTAVARNLVRVRVEREIADAQRGHAARRAAPEQRAHACEQLLAFERLDEVVVGADVQALHARLQCVACGEHQDRRVVPVVAQATGDIEAVQPRQAEVEDDDVGQEGVGLVEAAHPIGGELDLIALQAQRALQDLGDLLVVFDDEHTDGTARGFHYIFMLRPARRK